MELLNKLYEITLYKYNACQYSIKNAKDENTIEERVWEEQAYRMIFDLCNIIHRNKKHVNADYICSILEAKASQVNEWMFEASEKFGFERINPFVIMYDTIDSIYDDFILNIETKGLCKEDIFYEF